MARAADWFYKLSKKAQAEYIKAHPTSKYAKLKDHHLTKTKLTHEQKIRDAIKDVKTSHRELKAANKKLSKAEDDYTIKLEKAKNSEHKKKIKKSQLPVIKKHHTALKKAQNKLRKSISKHHAAEDNYEIEVSRAEKQAKP